MDQEYEEAQKEIKEATRLKKEILNNVSRMPLPEGFTITFERYWTYPDNWTFKSERFGTRLCLRQKGQAIGLLNFTISPDNIIDIYSIQGVKNSKNRPPKNWTNILTGTFILACLPNLVNHKYRIYYQGKDELNGEISYYNKLKKELEDSNIKKEKKQENLETIRVFENKRIFIKKILEDYFDKDGFLNFNRLKTKNLVEALGKLKLKEKPKISPYKRRKLTRIKARPRLA